MKDSTKWNEKVNVEKGRDYIHKCLENFLRKRFFFFVSEMSICLSWLRELCDILSSVLVDNKEKFCIMLCELG